MEKPLTSTVLMIRPVRFAYNAQTAVNNSFQNADAQNEHTQAQAQAEFDEMVAALRGAGVEVLVYEDTPEPHTPDSIFPNNWVSFHADGRVILYPMFAPNRRVERRADILEDLGRHFRIAEVIDLSGSEAEGKFLEGTGSLVLDRPKRVAYACLSPRADAELLADFGKRFGYQMVVFDALDRHGKPIYHTNVVMCVGDKFVVICMECIPDAQREGVRQAILDTRKDLIEIGFDQLENFAGNMLNITNQAGETLLVMSARAYQSLTESQKQQLSAYARLLPMPLTTIEDNGGGSARCMLAEVFLEKK